MSRSALFRLLPLLAAGLLLIGCGPERVEPTATPTKTPQQADAAAASASTATAAPASEVSGGVSEEVIEMTSTPVAAPAPALESPPRAENVAPYTGLTVADPATLQRRPLFVCVNNDPVGRSKHHGLSRADIVYEYIVDGFTVTRLTAMYQSQEAEQIGPVRSARFPNIWMTYMYDGALACSGGSDAIRYLLKNDVGFPYLDADIDDPSQTQYFFNVGSDYRTRMQTSTDGIRQWLQNNSLAKSWDRPGFVFNSETPPNSAGNASSVQISYPGGNNVDWRYDPLQNGYIRLQGGQQQFDLLTGAPIIAQNVIVVAAQHELTDVVEDSLGTKGVDITLYGFGDLRIFRDRQVYEGTWRADPENPPRWLGPGEAVIALLPGQTWVQITQEITDITYE